MTSATSLGHAREAFPASGLDALVAAAARDCPDLPLLRDDAGASTARQLARRVSRLAALLRHAGFAPGERVLIVAGATSAAVVALAATLRAELEPALMPVGRSAVEIAAHVQAAGAVALVGPSRYGALELGEAYLSAAAVADSIRMIATQGPEPLDGAVDISFARLDAMVDITDPSVVPVHGELPAIATFQGPPSAPMLVSHRQTALFADALSLVEQARINPAARILSTLPPTSLAGLVAGPCAALIGASGLNLHGPFEAMRFLAACDLEPGFHLVAPSAAGSVFEDGALTVDMASLIVLSRFDSADAFELPRPIDCDRPLVDLYAFGEDTILCQRRVEGTAHAPSRVADKSQVADKSHVADKIRGDGLGAQLNRALAEHRRSGSEGA